MEEITANFILEQNKPLKATFKAYNEPPNIGGTTDYIWLDNKPSINGVVLQDDVSLEQLGVQPVGDYALTSEIPDVSGFATRDEIPDVSNFASKSEIPDVSDFVTQEYVSELFNGVYTKAEIDSMLGEISTVLDTINGEEI